MRVSLDTSVFSAYYDDRTPERLQMTRESWPRLMEHDKLCSTLALKEFQASRPDLATRLRNLAEGFHVIETTPDVRRLARIYVAEGVVSPRYIVDAVHLAAAVTADADVLLSWNFRHLVRRSTRLLVNYVNSKHGIQGIEILAPPEF